MMTRFIFVKYKVLSGRTRNRKGVELVPPPPKVCGEKSLVGDRKYLIKSRGGFLGSWSFVILTRRPTASNQ